MGATYIRSVLMIIIKRRDASRSEEGSGLGLSIVASLVKAHGGNTQVSSNPGEGSCFKVYLPLAGN